MRILIKDSLLPETTRHLKGAVHEIILDDLMKEISTVEAVIARSRTQSTREAPVVCPYRFLRHSR